MFARAMTLPLTVAVLFLLGTHDAPGPKHPGIGEVTLTALRADSVAAAVAIELPDDGRGAVDSLFVTQTLTTSTNVQRLTIPAPARLQRVSFTWFGTSGQTLSGQTCATSKRAGVLSPQTCKNWTRTVPVVAPPAPIIRDTAGFAWVNRAGLPALVAVQPGDSMVMCRLFQFSDGAVGYKAISREPHCDAMAQRLGTPLTEAEQAAADTTCSHFLFISGVDTTRDLVVDANPCEGVALVRVIAR